MQYKLIGDGITCIICAIIVLILGYLIVLFCKKAKHDNEYYGFVYYGFVCGCSLVALFCILIFTYKLVDVLQDIYTPKAVLYKMIFKG